MSGQFGWARDGDTKALARAIREAPWEPMRQEAERVRREVYGNAVYIRGLIEFTSYCKNNCLYCGIRRDNRAIGRYRLTAGEVLACCQEGYGLGFRTFVLQGGEDPYFTDDRVCAIVEKIKGQFPDCAVTLSLGERSRESYQRLFDAGADRYLLRHETFSRAHYEMLHPADMSYENRIRCLYDLKDIGYQVGTGFMVGSPGQTAEHLAEDLAFIRTLRPHRVGIGPFVPHHATPFAGEPRGSVELTLTLLSMIRLILPEVLLPATTALETLDSQAGKGDFGRGQRGHAEFIPKGSAGQISDLRQQGQLGQRGGGGAGAAPPGYEENWL